MEYKDFTENMRTIFAELDYLFQEGVVVNNRADLEDLIENIEDQKGLALHFFEMEALKSYCDHNKMFYKSPLFKMLKEE
jgi:hypothetical protein